MRYAFQDDENCFFVLDLMLGGDLRCTSAKAPPLFIDSWIDLDIHLQSILSAWAPSVKRLFGFMSLKSLLPSHSSTRNGLSTGQSNFPVVPPTGPALTHQHRDLKPDNILLDEKGHAHITDLNIAVHYSERRLLTGVAGSMAYMGMSVALAFSTFY